MRDTGEHAPLLRACVQTGEVEKYKLHKICSLRPVSTLPKHRPQRVPSSSAACHGILWTFWACKVILSPTIGEILIQTRYLIFPKVWDPCRWTLEQSEVKHAPAQLCMLDVFLSRLWTAKQHIIILDILNIYTGGKMFPMSILNRAPVCMCLKWLYVKMHHNIGEPPFFMT